MAVKISPHQPFPYRPSARFVAVQATFLVPIEPDATHPHENAEVAAVRLVHTTVGKAVSEGTITVDAAVYRTRFVYHSSDRGEVFYRLANGDLNHTVWIEPE